MNIPNFISILRFFITFFFIIAVYEGKFRTGLYLFMLQGLSDLLDGFLARTVSKKTRLGAFLDPLADKTMLVSSYVVLYIKNIIPCWLTGIILARDIVLIVGFFILYRLAYQEKPVPSILGKITTTLQMLTVVYVLWSDTREYGVYFFYTTAFFTIASGCHYIARGFRAFLQKKPT